MKKILIFLSILLFIKNSDINLEQIRADILSNHNEHRKAHQVEPLTRDSEIEKVAQAYSEYLASISQMVHSNNELYGENLYYCYNSAKICVTGDEASENWYEEISMYDYNNPGFSLKTGHFTQLVWKGSKKIGCGAACNLDNKCYVTCNYSPPGNYRDEFAENVLKLIEDEGDNGMHLNTKKILYIISLLILIF